VLLCRLDNSSELASEARYAFAAGLAVGEAGMQLARQALLIAAEDDAIGAQHPTAVLAVLRWGTYEWKYPAWAAN
jgi:hypothetical protein